MSHPADIPHLAFPFHLHEGGRIETVEQDTLDEVAQNVHVFLSTVRGERIELLDYGVDDFAFMVSLPVHSVLSEIERWEPRASVHLSEQPDTTDELLRLVEVNVARRGRA